MKKNLSIGIFAYNQLEQIKKQLDELTKYKFDDIEIVVSDDTNDDSIEKLALSYNDKRIVYVRNSLGSGADGNYLNAIKAATSDYVWIFRSSDTVIGDKIPKVISLIEDNTDCSLYFLSSQPGYGLRERNYSDIVKKSVWHSGTLHPSGYIINKKYCDFDLYESYIKEYFEDFKASNVAFFLLQADLGLKGDTLFSSIVAWRYLQTVERKDRAVNAPDGKNPFGLDYEYKRYALMLDYASSISNAATQKKFVITVIHTFAKQILHIFGKRNSSKAFLDHYGCESVDFNPYRERKKYICETTNILRNLELREKEYHNMIRKEAFIYGVIKPSIYKLRNIK